MGDGGEGAQRAHKVVGVAAGTARGVGTDWLILQEGVGGNRGDEEGEQVQEGHRHAAGHGRLGQQEEKVIQLYPSIIHARTYFIA